MRRLVSFLTVAALLLAFMAAIQLVNASGMQDSLIKYSDEDVSSAYLPEGAMWNADILDGSFNGYYGWAWEGSGDKPVNREMFRSVSETSEPAGVRVGGKSIAMDFTQAQYTPERSGCPLTKIVFAETIAPKAVPTTYTIFFWVKGVATPQQPVVSTSDLYVNGKTYNSGLVFPDEYNDSYMVSTMGYGHEWFYFTSVAAARPAEGNGDPSAANAYFAAGNWMLYAKSFTIQPKDIAGRDNDVIEFEICFDRPASGGNYGATYYIDGISVVEGTTVPAWADQDFIGLSNVSLTATAPGGVKTLTASFMSNENIDFTSGSANAVVSLYYTKNSNTLYPLLNQYGQPIVYDGKAGGFGWPYTTGIPAFTQINFNITSAYTNTGASLEDLWNDGNVTFVAVIRTVRPDGVEGVTRAFAYPSARSIPQAATVEVSLTGTDGVNRLAKGIDYCVSTRSDKYVGLFYFLWSGEQGDRAFNVEQIIAKNGGDLMNPQGIVPYSIWDKRHPDWGNDGEFHFWDEPMFGYYYVRDPWILRKHCEMLTAAGIDFIAFDLTNGWSYDSVLSSLLQVWKEYADMGWKVPKLTFYTSTAVQWGSYLGDNMINYLYDTYYTNPQWANLWFYLDGKPMIVGYANGSSSPPVPAATSTCKNFFNIKEVQWPYESNKINGFPWIDWTRPQVPCYNSESDRSAKRNPQVMSVSVAQHPQHPFTKTAFYRVEGNWGRSYRDKADNNNQNFYYFSGSSNQVGDYNYGFNLEKQFKNALSTDPRIIFITSWNEWIAQKLDWTDSSVYPTVAKIAFVDSATREFSRDIEPMKGGFGDNYYLQMIDNIRKFKLKNVESNALKPVSKSTISIPGDFKQWKKDGYAYYDFEGDVRDRNFEGFQVKDAGGNWVKRYEVDTSGRNDIVATKVTFDSTNVYFYVMTANPITPHNIGDTKWMNLLICTNFNTTNRPVRSGITNLNFDFLTSPSGFNNFQYIINRYPSGDYTSIEQSTGGFNWTTIGSVKYQVSGNEMQIAVPRSLIGLSSGKVKLAFKWADNITDPSNIQSYYTSGDAAPIGSLSYYFEEK